MTKVSVELIQLYSVLPCILIPVKTLPDIKIPGANMGLIWGQTDPDGPHVGPMNCAIWVGVITW